MCWYTSTMMPICFTGPSGSGPERRQTAPAISEATSTKENTSTTRPDFRVIEDTEFPSVYPRRGSDSRGPRQLFAGVAPLCPVGKIGAGVVLKGEGGRPRFSIFSHGLFPDGARGVGCCTPLPLRRPLLGHPRPTLAPRPPVLRLALLPPPPGCPRLRRSLFCFPPAWPLSF